MTFIEKIDKILTIKGIALWRLAELSQLNSTLEKAYAQNRNMRATTTAKFLQNLRINREWWETGKGEVFLEDVPEKPQKLRDIDIIESENYIGMHRRVYDTLEKNMDTHRILMMRMSETIKNLTGNQGGSPGGKQVSLPRE